MPTPQNPSTISQPIGAPMMMSGGPMIMSGPGFTGSMSMPIAQGAPVMMGSVSLPNAAPTAVAPAVGGIPAVGAKQYPEGQPVGTLPYEVPPYPEDTPLTAELCRILQVPQGTLWGAAMGGDSGVVTTQEV